jgi:hypothetical protein
MEEKHGGSKAYYLEASWWEDKVALESHFHLPFIVQTKLTSQPLFFQKNFPITKNLLFFKHLLCGDGELQKTFIFSTFK